MMFHTASNKLVVIQSDQDIIIDRKNIDDGINSSALT
jgi:hypothetical protein